MISHNKGGASIGRERETDRSDRFETRDRAALHLRQLKHLAEPAFEKALAGKPSAEVRRIVGELLERLDAVPEGAGLRPLRAIEALERAGTPAALALLESLAGGAAGSRQTEAARVALSRWRR